MISDFLIILIHYLWQIGCAQRTRTQYSAHFALFSNFFVFQGRDLIFGMQHEWGFHNHSYSLFFWQIGCAQCKRTQYSAHCALFSNFLFFKVESCNLVCRGEFGFRKHPYTLYNLIIFVRTLKQNWRQSFVYLTQKNIKMLDKLPSFYLIISISWIKLSS